MLTQIFNTNILLPLSDLLQGSSIYKKLRFLQRSQWWSADELEHFQNERLSSIINYSYYNFPFYKQLFMNAGISPDDIKGISDLKKVPIINKSGIREIIKEIKPSKNKQIPNWSSGSTGSPLKYYYNQEAYSLRMASGIRAWNWMGFQLGDKYVKLSQNPRNSHIKKVQDFLNRSKYIYVKELSEKSLTDAYNSIVSYKPEYLRSYPDPLKLMVKFLMEQGVEGIKLKGINTTGNILFQKDRENIESFFQCKIYDSYSCEGTGSLSQCEYGNYHFTSEYSVNEVVGEDSQQVKDGETGRLIVTDLWNSTTPFIRYDTQDLVVNSEIECSCGRNHKVISRIEGRDSDVLITPDNRFIIVHSATIFFEKYEEVLQFQIQQKTKADFILFLVVTPNYNQSMHQEIFDYWANYLGETSKLELVITDEIELSSSGKRRFLIRNPELKINF